MKKIDFWIPYFGNVGTIKATIHSAEAIKDYSNEEVEINLFKIHSEWEGYEDDIKNANLNIVDFGLKKYFKKLPKYGFMYRLSMILIMFYSIPKLVQYFNKNKPDIVIAYLQGITTIIARMLSRHKPKIIISIQGLPSFLASSKVYDTYPLYKKVESKLRIWIWKKLLKKADSIIALTQKTRDNLTDILDFDNNKIIYIPNPIIDDSINLKKDEEIQEELFLQNDIILGIGRYTRQKDFTTLIKAFNRVLKEKENLKLIVLGEGEQREELQNLIDNLDMKENAILYGFVNNPYKYLSKAKLFVLSSLWEDQGHTLVEAVYLNVPVLSTKCPSGQEELLSYGQAGYLCNLSDEKDMANKIIEALNSNNLDKVDLAYQNSLQFTSEAFYKKLERCL